VLLSIWTRKEAVLKAQGTGLLRSPHAITALQRADGREVVFADVVEGCAVRELHRPPNLHISVAVDGISTDLGSPSVELSDLDRVDVPQR
jgi:phosphopantetheinyl transferase (holo-ACP synthase)